MKLEKVLVVYKKKDKTGVLNSVKVVLKKEGIRFSAVDRERVKQIKGVDLVVVIGGDGTLLRVAHKIDDNIPVLGVNSSPKTSEGFFLRYNKNNFSKVISKLLKEKAKIISLMRLKAKINNRQIKTFALNEFYVGCKQSYKTARCTIRVGNKSEWQRNSGVITATPAGTNAWFKSGGGKKLKLGSKKFSFLVREPYRGRLVKPKLIHGAISQNKSITIISDMYSGILAIDAIVEIPLKQYDTVTISSAKPLRFVL